MNSEELARTYDMLNTGAGVNWMAKSPDGHSIIGSKSKSKDQFLRHAAAQADWNFFVSLNPADTMRCKPSKTDITHLACVGLDLDPLHNEHINYPLLQEKLDTIFWQLFKVPAHYIYDSGRGIWAWLFIEPLKLRTPDQRMEADLVLKAFGRCIAETTDLSRYAILDTTSTELSRVARCPGSTNQKTKRAVASMVQYSPQTRIPYSQLVELTEPYMLPPQMTAPHVVTGTSVADIAPSLNTTSRQFVLLGVDKAVESRHRRLWSTAKNLHELSISPDIARLVLSAGAQLCKPNLLEDDPTAIDRVITQIWR